MLRMEIALILILVFVAYVYFSAGRKYTPLHRTFSILLVALIIHLVFDAATVYTVNHLDTVPRLLNDILHRIFIGSMSLIVYLFYHYMAILVDEGTGKFRWLNLAAKIYLVVAAVATVVLPIHYAVTPQGNYSDGIHAEVCYVSTAFYLLLCAWMLLVNWKEIEQKKKFAIGVALLIMIFVSLLQAFHPTWLISGMGMTLMTLAFYLTLENPDILRAELTEQKMSMLYLKSQVNPHFLYNTLDAIRIQAQLNGDRKVADLLMRLVDFFRLSVKVDRQMVELDDELELLEAYMELMCYRYPKLECEYEIDPDLGGVKVPNFILQPIVENSLLHGLKNKGYQGKVRIVAQKLPENEKRMEIQVMDTGSGFAEGKKEKIDRMLLQYDRQAPKLEGNSIGILNVQKRIKYLCGQDCGLWYTENTDGGVTAHMRLPITWEVRE
ncbi:MAG: histidine kinase [Dorea sp.]|uniref:sensor histidine kinase n=1 Tax=Dorea sp. YH-dor226 TaxID=3151119 RepID=UPI003035B7C8|nr:histidine kinase [Dorea sp.]